MSLKGSWNHVWIWRATPPLADERDNLELSPGPFSTRAVYLQFCGCFCLPKAAAKLSVKTWLCTSSVRTLSLLWYMSHFIPYNSCTSPTLGLRGLELSITLVIIFMTGLQKPFSSAVPSAQGRGLLLKGYRCDRWEHGPSVWSTAPSGHRQNVCVCFTFVKLLLMSAGKVSPAGSFLLSIPSWLAFAMKELYPGESLLDQGERKGGPGHKVLPLTRVFPIPPLSTLRDGRRWQDQLHVLIKHWISVMEEGIIQADISGEEMWTSVLFLLQHLGGFCPSGDVITWSWAQPGKGLDGLSVMREHTGVCLHRELTGITLSQRGFADWDDHS